jgi:DNA-binding NtrC family response regulator
VRRICLLDWSGSRRNALALALRPLVDGIELLDADTFQATFADQFEPDVIVLFGLGDAHDDAEFKIVRRFCARGCEVIAYADGWDAAALSRRCAALLAGAVDIIDSRRSDFASELRRRLSLAIRQHEQRHEEKQHLCDVMAQFGLIGQSMVTQALGRWILKVAPLSDLGVLITGETGTGKELVARAIHGLDPKRCRGPFVPINCAALTTSLAEGELFGHRKGAFTGAHQDRRGLIRSANGGTLFLDEIGDLDLALQAKLLRVLQENRVRPVGDEREDRINVRIIAATNQDLAAMVERGQFRKDLFYRLNLLTTTVPALSERGDDLERLVRHFVQKYGGTRSIRVASSLIAALKVLKMPGNVRQLENLIRHALANVGKEGTLGIEELPESVWEQLSRTTDEPSRKAAAHDWAALLDSNAWSLAQSLLVCERHFLKVALTRSQGNQSATARLLGITPRSMYNKIRKHRLVG